MNYPPQDYELQYELIDHTADMGIRVWGKNRKVLFANAGQAMFDLIVRTERVEAEQLEQVQVTGNDIVDLLINWLRELLFIWTGKERLVHTIEIESLTGTKLIGGVTTYPFHSNRHAIRHELKAVTYHQAKVEKCGDGWMAEVIFDV